MRCGDFVLVHLEGAIGRSPAPTGRPALPSTGGALHRPPCPSGVDHGECIRARLDAARAFSRMSVWFGDSCVISGLRVTARQAPPRAPTSPAIAEHDAAFLDVRAGNVDLDRIDRRGVELARDLDVLVGQPDTFATSAFRENRAPTLRARGRPGFCSRSRSACPSASRAMRRMPAAPCRSCPWHDRPGVAVREPRCACTLHETTQPEQHDGEAVSRVRARARDRGCGGGGGMANYGYKPLRHFNIVLHQPNSPTPAASSPVRQYRRARLVRPLSFTLDKRSLRHRGAHYDDSRP